MRAVVDTNVLLVADGEHKDVSPDCVSSCVDGLEGLKNQGIVVIDDDYHLIGEYLHKTDTRRGKGVGAAFLKWLLQNQANPAHVERVHITETAPDHFEEFPDPALESAFDPPDRKFVAVANAHPDKPPIWQATDSRWLDWWPTLAGYGLRVEFLCREDVLRFYKAKSPARETPSLP